MTEADHADSNRQALRLPIILVGSDTGRAFRIGSDVTLVAKGAVSEEDLDFIHLTDDPEEALDHHPAKPRGLGLKLVRS